MATRLTPTGDFRESTFACVVCHEPIVGIGAEYMHVEVLDERGAVCYKSLEPIRRHFLNDTHAVDMLISHPAVHTR